MCVEILYSSFQDVVLMEAFHGGISFVIVVKKSRKKRVDLGGYIFNSWT